MSSPIEVGQLAPDFTLQGWAQGEVLDYTLSVRRGQPVVLAFYPGDGTAVCTRQMCSYSDNLEVFRSLDAVVWGISPQGLDSKREFANHKDLKLPLLADVDTKVSEAYGITSRMGIKRSIFVIDAEGRVAWRDIRATGITYKSVKAISAALEGLKNPST